VVLALVLSVIPFIYPALGYVLNDSIGMRLENYKKSCSKWNLSGIFRPKAKSGVFTIVLSKLENDRNDNVHSMLDRAIRDIQKNDFAGLPVDYIRLDCIEKTEDDRRSTVAKTIQRTTSEGRWLLSQMNSHVLIWGKVTGDQKDILNPDLFFTNRGSHFGSFDRDGSYGTEKKLVVAQKFETDTRVVLAAAIAGELISTTGLETKISNAMLSTLTDNAAKTIDRLLPQVGADIERARLLRSIGISLTNVGYRNGNTEEVRRGILYEERAIAYFDKVENSFEWASTHLNLAQNKRTLARNTDSISEYAAARKHLDSALQVFRKEDHPRQWALINFVLGTSLGEQGDLQKDFFLQIEAALAFSAALNVTTLKTDPEQWVNTQNNLSNLYRQIGVLIRSEEYLNDSLRLIELAINHTDRNRFERQWAIAKFNQCRTLTSISRRKAEFQSDLSRALEACKASLSSLGPSNATHFWRSASASYGEVLVEMGLRSSSLEQLSKAERVFRDLLDTLPLTGQESLRKNVQSLLHSTQLYIAQFGAASEHSR
jgi:tetratricopeptide (TPR) repeat protein